MRKYKITLEAEIELNDYLDLDLTLFNNQNSSSIYESEEVYSSEYKFSLELFETCCGDTFATADITNIEIKEYND